MTFGSSLLRRFRKKRPSVLVSYLKSPLHEKKNDPLTGHSNRWESREITRLLGELGATVDTIDWNDEAYVPTKHYTAVLDIGLNLYRLGSRLPGARLLLHATGAYPLFSNRAEAERADAFERRTGKPYTCKRHVDEHFLQSLGIADHISLVGNSAHALATYPAEYQKKIALIPVTGSALRKPRRPDEFTPSSREFLWYGGHGAVHKGLDLVLEVFLRRPQNVLHIAGAAHTEPDFMAVYGERMMNAPNIRFHGWMDPYSADFNERMRNVFCFILPSCSESTSTAAVTCMQFGMMGIVSHQCGLDLPPSAGHLVLRALDEKEIEQLIDLALQKSDEEVRHIVGAMQYIMTRNHSRDAFSKAMHSYLARAIGPSLRDC